MGDHWGPSGRPFDPRRAGGRMGDHWGPSGRPFVPKRVSGPETRFGATEAHWAICLRVAHSGATKANWAICLRVAHSAFGSRKTIRRDGGPLGNFRLSGQDRRLGAPGVEWATTRAQVVAHSRFNNLLHTIQLIAKRTFTNETDFAISTENVSIERGSKKR